MYVIIPCLNPDDNFIEVFEGLKKQKIKNIITVDDGSDKDKKHYFKTVEKKYGAIVLTHDVNKGKGRALKTAFEYYYNNIKDDEGVITIDADNQHTPEDIVRMHDALKKHPGSLILGVRNFDEPQVPLRSKIGNKITIFSLNFFCSLAISDTQTGLRAIPRKFVDDMLLIKGEKFEYETNMLLETTKLNIPIHEIKIDTIYEETNNLTSHFNTFTDSFLIYKEIFKFASVSIISMLIDYISFLIIFTAMLQTSIKEGQAILLATILARIISSLFNFTTNKKLVFKHKSNIKETMKRYYTVVACQLTASATLVYLLRITTGLIPGISKLIVDFILFFIGYKFQRKYVFKRRKK